MPEQNPTKKTKKLSQRYHKHIIRFLRQQRANDDAGISSGGANSINRGDFNGDTPLIAMSSHAGGKSDFE